MRMITLAAYDLRRLFRHRALILLLFTLPLATGLIRAALPKSGFASTCVWWCLVTCAILTGAAVQAHRLIDRLCGLDDAFRNAQLTPKCLAASRVIAGGALLAGQVAVLLVLIAFRS